MSGQSDEFDSSLEPSDLAIIGLGIVLLGAVGWHMMLSCLQLVRSFRSADNIWERSRSSKRATVRGREFVFHQQYREAGMGVGSALWDGSVILSEYLMRECDIRGKRVLVVGAGGLAVSELA